GPAEIVPVVEQPGLAGGLDIHTELHRICVPPLLGYVESDHVVVPLPLQAVGRGGKAHSVSGRIAATNRIDHPIAVLPLPDDGAAKSVLLGQVHGQDHPSVRRPMDAIRRLDIPQVVHRHLLVPDLLPRSARDVPHAKTSAIHHHPRAPTDVLLTRAALEYRCGLDALECFAVVLADREARQEAIADFSAQLESDVVHEEPTVRDTEHCRLEHAVVVERTRLADVQHGCLGFPDYPAWIAGVEVHVSDAAHTMLIAALHVDAQHVLVKPDRS